MSDISGVSNYVEKVPGTTVTCFLGRFDETPSMWAYSLWTEGDEELISTGWLEIPQPDTYTITPQQVARIAFLLDVDYAPKGE